MDYIQPELLGIALDRTGWEDFEKFINALASSIFGYNLNPLGGVKDGGADAFVENSPYESSDRPGLFIQTSLQEDVKSKIKKTISRIEEFGRELRTLYFFSSRDIKEIDIIEQDLSDTYNVIVRIKDKKWIEANINKNSETKAAFRAYLLKYTDFLKSIGSSAVAKNINEGIPDEVILYLSKEIESTENTEKILFKLCDGLILWSLEGTDPNTDTLMSEADITKKIFETLPQTKQILKGVISNRLTVLKKAPKKERQIRYHSDQKGYCLTYEIREKIYQDNIQDEAILIDVKEQFKKRIISRMEKIEDSDLSIAVNVSLRTIQSLYQHEGYEITIAINSDTSKYNQKKPVSDLVDKFLAASPKPKIPIKDMHYLISDNIHEAFINGGQSEKVLFRRYSILYTLLFTVNVEPKVLEFFQNMRNDLNLYIGSDVLIRALSERYNNKENQTIRNTIKIIIQANSKFILTTPICEEVYYHLRSTHFEYLNNYKVFDDSGALELLDNSDRILIRSYAKAKRSNTALHWYDYIDGFCDYDELTQNRAYESIKTYLLSQFNLEFESDEDLKSLCDPKELKALKEKLIPWKSTEKLAENDAMMALAIYGKREKNRENTIIKQFGYSTWWFTSETSILKYTHDLIQKKNSRYMMRPSFILKYMTFAPKYAEARQLLQELFPSDLGIFVTRRVDPEILQDILKEGQRISNMEEGRKLAKVRECCNKLKGGIGKYYYE